MQHEREIDALLSSGETGSIIDRLMALPQSDRRCEHERMGSRRQPAVSKIRLARQMRSQIDAATQRSIRTRR